MSARCSALLILFAVPAFAHKLAHPKRDLVLVEREKARVLVTLELDPGEPSSGAKALFDRDSDGRLSPAEQDLFVGFMARVAEQGLVISDGGRRVALLRRAARGLGLDRAVADSAIVGVELELEGTLGPLGSGRALRLEDRTRDGKSHVLAEVRAAEGLELARASQGELSEDRRRIEGAMLSQDTALELRVRGPAAGAWDRLLRWVGLR